MSNELNAPSIDPSLEGVGHLLRDGLLEIPLYQRSYSWETEDVETFWYDLRAALVSNEPIYFLGTVVISTGGHERAAVIDGQQRLTTASVLFASIRDQFLERGDEVRAATIQQRYLAVTSLESTSVEPRLHMNRQDREYFDAHIVESGAFTAASADHPRSVRLMSMAYQRLSELLREDVQSAGPRWQQRLLDWISFLDQRARVIAVRVRDDADAFLIFETLNARGVELSAADLIKNYLFGLCRSRLEYAQEIWTSVLQSLDEVSASTELTTFLRQWWSSQNGATRERDLYRRLKANVQSEDQALEALQDLRLTAPRFAAMLSPEHEFWDTFPDRTRKSVAVLLDLGLEQFRPLFLAATGKFSPPETDRLLRSLVHWSVRGLIVGGIGGGTTERYYAEAAVRVNNERSNSTQSVFDELTPVIPDDEEFRSPFASRRVPRLKLASYYLRSVSERTSLPTEPASAFRTAPLITARNAHLILGRDGEATQRVAADARSRLGNLVLLPRGTEIQDADDRYLEMALSHDLVVPDALDETDPADVVRARQARMSDLAIAIWPRD